MDKKRLLIIEDERAIANLVSKVALEVDFETRIVTEHFNIKRVYDSFLPDVIVLDILMPEMDGFEVLEYLNSHCCHARIIILSGQDPYRQMAERMGMARGLTVMGNIRKPFRTAELRETLKKIHESISTPINKTGFTQNLTGTS